MSEIIRECPFCSGRGAGIDIGINGFHFVTCNGCLSTGPVATDLKEAAEAWNRRHQEQEPSSEFERMMK